MKFKAVYALSTKHSITPLTAGTTVDNLKNCMQQTETGKTHKKQKMKKKKQKKMKKHRKKKASHIPGRLHRRVQRQHPMSKRHLQLCLSSSQAKTRMS
jgi:RNA polymerase-interacting CarD/CdnL/TRCF family regulator